MSITRTIITTVVALALVAVVAPAAGSAQTMTTAQLMAEIAALQAQLSGLSTTTTTTMSTGACAGVTFTRNLTVGSRGQDVMCMQVLLNSHGYVLATAGAGSPGHETMYFGPLTLRGVRKWQAAQGWAPANQIGPLSRALLNSWLASSGSTTTTTTTTSTVQGCTSTSGFSPVTGQSCATGVVTQSGPVSAVLSADNPAAGSIVGGQATADLAHFTFNGTGTVSSITLQRSGISDQNTLTNVYLYQGNTRLTDGYSFNVNGQIVINGLSITVNGATEISVKADVSATAANTASTIAVSLVGYTANSVTSTANLMGNTMQIVVGNLATASLGANTVSSANVNAGTTGYTFWSAPLQVNTRAIWLKVANFKMVGSAPSDALTNMRMFIDGVDTGVTGTLTSENGSNYAMFDFTAAPISLSTGSHTIDFRGDVNDGSDRNITVSVEEASDLVLFDSQIGVNIAVSGTIPNNAGTVNINTGSATVVVDPNFTPQTNVSGGATNVVIGQFIIHSYGEAVKINTINVIPSILGATSKDTLCTTDATLGSAGTPADCGLNNVTLYFGPSTSQLSQIGSQINYSSGTYTMGTVTSGTPIVYTLGSQMIAPAGQDSVLQVRADLQTSLNSAYTGGTVKVGLPALTTNAQGQTSQNTVGVPSAAVATNGLTIQTGLLAVAKNTAYLNQSITPNMAGVEIGSYVIQNQSTSESQRITSYSITTGTGTTVTNTNGTIGGGSGAPTINNFSALRTSDTTGSGSTPVQFSGTGTGFTSTDVFSVNDTLAPGASMTVNVYANTSTASSGQITTTLNVSSIGVNDNIPATSGAKSGQILSLGNGVIAQPPTIVVSSTTPAQYISAAGGATNASQATFNFVSTQGASTITELKFNVSGSDASPSQTVTNVCVGVICAQPVAGVADLTGLSLSVPNGGGGLTQNAQVSYSPVGTSGITPGTTSVVALSYVKFQSGGVTATICAPQGSCTYAMGGSGVNGLVPAPAVTLVGSQPVVVVAQTTPASGLILGAENQVGQVTVSAASQGSIKVRQIVFTLGFGGFGTNPTMSAPRLASGSTTITGSTCSGTTVVTCTFTGASYATDYTIAAGQSQVFNLYETNNSGIVSSGATASISSSVSPSSSFLWDDTSTNGASGTGLTGTLIYNFPTNSYSIHQ